MARGHTARRGLLSKGKGPSREWEGPSVCLRQSARIGQARTGDQDPAKGSAGAEASWPSAKKFSAALLFSLAGVYRAA